MRLHLKFLVYLIVAIGFSWANAGSYDDFFRAIKRDDAATIRSLLNRGFDPNTPSQDGQHGLFLALREPSPQVASLLIDWPQTQVEHRNLDDESPLMMAALKGEAVLVRRLIARDADVNKPGWAPLHYAATGGRPEVIRILLNADAYIDAESPNGSTPLMMAAMYGSEEAVKLLLEAGADATLKNQLGLTAKDFAGRSGRQFLVDLLESHLKRAAPASSPGSW